MKNIVNQLKLTMILTLGLMATSAVAQSGKYGKTAEDSVVCIENLSVYKDFLREKKYDKAKEYWRKAFKVCPQSSLKMYVDGEKILNNLIKGEKDNEAREKQLIDTLLLLYDVRIENFGKEGYVLGKKGSAMYKYGYPSYKAAYATLKKSLDLEGNKSQAAAIVYYFQAAVKLHKEEPIAPEIWVEMFNQCVTIIDYNLANQKDPKRNEQYRTAMENVLILVDPFLNCDVLVKFFEQKFEEKKSNALWLENSSKVLDDKGCSNAQIFYTIANQLHTLNPSAVSAKNMGIMSMNNAKYNDAEKFFVQAIDLADDNTDDENLDKVLADLELMLAKAFYGQKDFTSSRTHARKAATYNPKWGEPYILIGDMYAGSVSLCKEDPDGVLKSPYWVAVDMYAKAKSVDPSVANDASQKIAKYSQYFPTTQDAFFYGVTDGSDYTVQCWIKTVTKARLK